MRTWCHRWALLAGWVAGMVAGLLMLYDTPTRPRARRTSAARSTRWPARLRHEGAVYTGLLALLVNLAVTAALTVVFRALRVPGGRDVTADHDYEAEAAEPGVEPLPGTAEQEERVAEPRFTRTERPTRVRR